MNKDQKQIYYWTHMLDETFDKDAFINEKNTFDNVKIPKDEKGALNAALKVLGDDTYDEFVDDLNTLAKDDADDKIKRFKDALIKRFNDKSAPVKIEYGNENVEVKKLRATQNEVCISNSLEKALYSKPPQEQAEALFPADNIVKLGPAICAAKIGDQYYVIDGHHRWSQAFCFNPTAKIAAFIIQSDSFKTSDDILKFVQMEIFVNVASKHNKIPSANGSGSADNNLFKATDEQIAAKCKEYMDKSKDKYKDEECSADALYPKMKKNPDEDASYETKRDFITKRILDNVKLLKKCDGDNDRKIMPQTGGTDDIAIDGGMKALFNQNSTKTQPLNLKESKMKKYTKRQILESIRYWKKKLNESTYSYQPQNLADATYKTKNGKSLSESYTRKQILDTVDYWCKKVRTLNESRLPYSKNKIIETCLYWQNCIRFGKFNKTGGRN